MSILLHHDMTYAPPYDDVWGISYSIQSEVHIKFKSRVKVPGNVAGPGMLRCIVRCNSDVEEANRNICKTLPPLVFVVPSTPHRTTASASGPTCSAPLAPTSFSGASSGNLGETAPYTTSHLRTQRLLMCIQCSERVLCLSMCQSFLCEEGGSLVPRTRSRAAMR